MRLPLQTMLLSVIAFSVGGIVTTLVYEYIGVTWKTRVKLHVSIEYAILCNELLLRLCKTRRFSDERLRLLKTWIVASRSSEHKHTMFLAEIKSNREIACKYE